MVYSPELLDYTMRPLQDVLRDRNPRGDDPHPQGSVARRRSRASPGGRIRRSAFRGIYTKLDEVRSLAEAQVKDKHPLDLSSSLAEAISDDGALVSDLLEGIEPVPDVVYLVHSARDSRGAGAADRRRNADPPILRAARP